MAEYDFGDAATPVKANEKKTYDFGDTATPVKATPFAPPKPNQLKIPNELEDPKLLAEWQKAHPNWNSSANRQQSKSEWERIFDAAGAGAMGVPIAGGLAGAGLKMMGKAPLIAQGAAKYARPIMEAMRPDSMRALLGLTGAGAVAGGVGEKARQSAENAGAGEFGQKMAEMGGGMATSVPGMAAAAVKRGVGNAVTNQIQKAMDTPFAKEGADLAKKTGIDLTLGQQTGNKLIQGAEATARQSYFTADKVLAADQRQAQQSIEALNKIADTINVRTLSDEGVGQRLQGAVTDAVKGVTALRDKQAALDYGKVRSMVGNKPIITYKNTVDTLKKIISENDGVVSEEAKKVAAKAKSMLKELTETQAAAEAGPRIANLTGGTHAPIAPPPKTEIIPKTVDVETARKNRSAWSSASHGNGNVFDDISPATNRVVAGRLAKAVANDFTEASTAGTPVAQALADANKNFAKNSDSIKYIQKSVLGKLLGQDIVDAGVTGATANTVSGEKVAKAYLRMAPSEAKTVTNILNVNNPEVLSEAKAYVIRGWLQKGMDLPVSAGAKTLGMSNNKAIGAMPKDLEIDQQLAAFGYTPKEIQSIKDVKAAMNRAGDRSGANNSGTAPMSQFMEMISSIVGGTKKIAGTGLQLAVQNKVANAMTSKEGRDALLTLSKFDPNKQATKEVNRAIAVLNAQDGGD